MTEWSNWSGRRTAQPETLHFVRSDDDALALAARATADGRTVRVAGSGHSHSPLVPNDDVIVDVSALAGVISVDHDTQRAWVRAGTTIAALGPALHAAGLALHNQGDIDRQTIAGACATGTHGTGRTLRNLSAAVTGARVATSSGELVECGETTAVDTWRVAQLNLGAIGIVIALELQLRPAVRVAETAFVTDLPDVEARIDELVDGNERCEFFWPPQTDIAWVKRINPTDEPAVYPIGQEGQRVGWSFEVLPSHRDQLHTEMEYSVPLASGPACFADLRDLLRSRFPEVEMPVEYRTLAGDDVWMSPAHGRDTVTLSVHRTIDADETVYFAACEEIFRHHDGRPHWGKVNSLTGDDLRAIHPAWDRWWAERDRLDPNGTFLNPYLAGLR